MKRSLRRHVQHAVRRTWNPRSFKYGNGAAAALVVFPRGAFADAPTWHPGQGFTSCLEGSWLRSNADGTATAVVTGVGPKERPAHDGGPWTEPEVWTVTAGKELLLSISSLWDKPHRISWMADEPGAAISREPYATHPQAAVEAYWEAFEHQWGFTPTSVPGTAERRYLLLSCKPGWADLPNEVDLMKTSRALARHFGATVRVYPYSPSRRALGGPRMRSDILAVQRIQRALQEQQGR
ncbi:hypothetical protein ACGF12_30425 [Kitasatospora sp. NPDC048296]|uniref:hypothetical protein n=1 Tax=Kitasatospora sp. NPDC048296 TaxID=3364048 RepID=UPI00371A058F